MDVPLRFSTVDGEDYGRGRVEEFLGDLKSLEALSQAIIEGSAAAAKVVFTVSPSATTKPQSLENVAMVPSLLDDLMTLVLFRLVRLLTSRLPMNWQVYWSAGSVKHF